MLAQLGSSLQNALLDQGLRTIPCATALMIGKRKPIQSLARAASNPQRHRAHVNPKLSGYRTQTIPGSDSLHHPATLAFNEAFLAMINSPQNPIPYRKCLANAEPQVFGER
jgi:hypothetical protein